jgi:translocation and assembly module TamA
VAQRRSPRQRDHVDAKRSAFALRAALLVAAAQLLAGCGSLSPPARTPDAAAPTGTGVTAPLREQYRFEIQAPDELQKLLAEHLNLARFKSAPVTEDITPTELDRLRAAAPAQMRELLETEGYFNAKVAVEQIAAEPGELPLLRAVVEPGPRATIGTASVDVVGELQTAADSGDASGVRLLADLRREWPLRSGSAFRLSAWADAKNSTLNKARAGGYAVSRWVRTNARVDTLGNKVNVAVVLDSGPLFKLGTIHIEGLTRYDENSVRRLAHFAPGDPYSEKTLQDFQERLQKVGLFEGATVEIDPDPKTFDAAAVRVRVKEQPLQQMTLGVGYKANTGASLSAEHLHRRLFGSRWIVKNKAELGPELKSWEGELTSHPLEGMYRNLVSGAWTRLKAADQVQYSWNLRVGRTQDRPGQERTVFAEFSNARVDSDALTSKADALSLNVHWLWRNVDSVLLPTVGLITSAQVAAGYGQGIESASGQQPFEERGPFARLYGRLTWYRPVGESWYATARLEAGQVFTNNVISVPDTLLFRAGGDESVRGYDYRTLGPSKGGTVTSGRSLLTGTLEIARPIWLNRPAYWWAAFIDAGNAANRFADLSPVLGYGVGLRWRSPVGPLRFDVAYGQEVRQVRVHVSVGIAL